MENIIKGKEIHDPSLEQLKLRMCTRHNPARTGRGKHSDWRKNECGILTGINGEMATILINVGGRLEAEIEIHYSNIRTCWEIWGADPEALQREFDTSLRKAWHMPPVTLQ